MLRNLRMFRMIRVKIQMVENQHQIGAGKNLILNFLYILIWTVIGVHGEYDVRYQYNLPNDSWRIVLWMVAVAFTVWKIVKELLEYTRSKRAHRNAMKWQTQEIKEDLKFCHPQWPEERHFLESELKELTKLSPNYFSDYWNIFDWLCYFLLLTSFITHLVDIGYHTNKIARAHVSVMSITIIILWLRLMKHARAFVVFGPFIVMLGYMMGDMVRFAFLYCELYIPYVCAFWMLFGGEKKPDSGEGPLISVTWFNSIDQVMFSLFRLTLVDEYDYETMKQVDSVMADILVGTWFALSAILCLNLFIALLSNTFQRVYDNAQEHALMQKAITILNIWERMSEERREKFLKYVHSECSPKRDPYDDDVATSGEENLKKYTIQIKEQLNELSEGLKEHDDTVGRLEKEIKDLKSSLKTIKILLQQQHGKNQTKPQTHEEYRDSQETATALPPFEVSTIHQTTPQPLDHIDTTEC